MVRYAGGALRTGGAAVYAWADRGRTAGRPGGCRAVPNQQVLCGVGRVGNGAALPDVYWNLGGHASADLGVEEGPVDSGSRRAEGPGE